MVIDSLLYLFFPSCVQPPPFYLVFHLVAASYFPFLPLLLYDYHSPVSVMFACKAEGSQLLAIAREEKSGRKLANEVDFAA